MANPDGVFTVGASAPTPARRRSVSSRHNRPAPTPIQDRALPEPPPDRPIFSGVPPPPPPGTTGLDTSGALDESLSASRRNVLSAMEEADRFIEFARGAREQEASRVHRREEAQAREAQEALVARRARLKAPTQEFMAIVDDIQDKLPDGTYLNLANRALEMYEIIEELDPSVTESAPDEPTREDVIIRVLGEENTRLKETLRVHQIQLRDKETKLKDLRHLFKSKTHDLNMLRCRFSLNLASLLKAETHRYLGPRFLLDRALHYIRTGVDEGRRRQIGAAFLAMRDVAKHPSYTIEAINYTKTEFTEGFGALGFALEDTDRLAEMLELAAVE